MTTKKGFVLLVVFLGLLAMLFQLVRSIHRAASDMQAAPLATGLPSISDLAHQHDSTKKD